MEKIEFTEEEIYCLGRVLDQVQDNMDEDDPEQEYVDMAYKVLNKIGSLKAAA